MPKNILIFSDGTGQRGGIYFDELRTNVYKLYRATRSGPDTSIDACTQLAFYDPGLGTEPTGETPVVRYWRRFHNFVSGATGLGITRNIIECYAAIIRLWQPGDRIYLFGFSRGAYTVRCVAAVLALCGVPTRAKDGSPLRRDESSSKKVAREAVTRVYQHVGSPREEKYVPQRTALAALFRQDYASEGKKRPANVYPYFIGVFDTGAALANKGALILVAVVSLALLIGASAALNWLMPAYSFWFWFVALFGIVVVVLAIAYLVSHLKFSFRLKDFSFWQTLHLNALRHAFYDQSLSPHVDYAKHALSLDERRADFARVKWGDPAEKRPSRDEHGYIWFEQLWFAGNHSDIGGGYPESESRLSDIALAWMVEATRRVPEEARIQIDPLLMRPSPSADGMQHDETRSAAFRFAAVKDRDAPKNATVHGTVRERFKLAGVLQYDVTAPYRPECLRQHEEFGVYYENPPPTRRRAKKQGKKKKEKT